MGQNGGGFDLVGVNWRLGESCRGLEQQGWFAADMVHLCVEAGMKPGVCQAAWSTNRGGRGDSYLSIQVLIGPDCTLDVINV